MWPWPRGPSPSPLVGRGVALASADRCVARMESQAARAYMHEIECVERLALNSLNRYRPISVKRFQTRAGVQPVPRDPNNVSKFDDACRCPHCATPLFQGEKSTMCCYDGKFKLSTCPPNPPELEELLEHPHIARYARVINQRFNMTSTPFPAGGGGGRGVCQSRTSA